MSDRQVVYVGIDVSKDSLSVDAGALFKGDVPNTPASIRGLIRKIGKKAGDGSVPHFCFESTGPYSESLFLECCGAGAAASVLNPAKVRHYAQAMSESAKTDPIDARVIRLFAEARNPEPTPAPSAAAVTLRKLVLARDALTKSVVQLSGTMEGASSGDAGSVLRSSVVLLRKKIKSLDRLIAEALKGDARLAGLAGALTEIAGVGILTAAKVVALVPELGTLGRRRSAAIAGLAPFTRDSGRCKGKTFISGGRAEVRRALFMPATVAIKHNPVLKAVYQNLMKAGKAYKVAITAIMRRLFAHMETVASKWLREYASATAAGPAPALP
jgi:transposase